MNHAASHSDQSPRSPLEGAIQEFGRTIFDEISRSQPSAFDKRYWSGRIMEWSMRRPRFKVELFRLVDVLPSLPSRSAIISHAQEYLGEALNEMQDLPGSGVLRWGLRGNARSIRGLLTSIAVMRGVREMAHTFIAGEDARKAEKALRRIRERRLAFTVDLLGEFSVSESEGIAYLDRYLDALQELGRSVPRWNIPVPLIPDHPGDSSPICVSVKLSALYSQCNPLNFERSVAVLTERLSRIARKAREVKASLYVDAEDSANNPIIYETFKRVFGSEEFRDVAYPGIVVQAYAKDSKHTLLDLLSFAERRGAPIAVRLVKGAYWDHETILSSQNDWPSPLFAQKKSSDANFEELSRILIDARPHVLPAFGSHNVRSLSHACCYAAQQGLSPMDFELQMLYGMADPIAHAFRDKGYFVRLYVPLGNLIVGMGYLVRRLLENTSNESFLRHTFVDTESIETLLQEPHMGD